MEDDNLPLSWLGGALANLKQAGLYRRLRTRSGPQGAVVTLDGQRLVNFGSNDYLGLAGDQQLVDAARSAATTEGWGSGASPLVNGRDTWHGKLEEELARFEQREAALLFSSGFAANVAAITSLVDREDVIFADAKNHASLIDGCRLSRADVQVYEHADETHLEQLIRSARNARRRLIVTDTLFSMDGDLAPLRKLAEFRDRYDCMFMVDEAHATGVFGSEGRGASEHFEIEDKVDVKVGTLSKAMGCAGGFVCGSQNLIEWLANRGRTYVFSTAQPSAGAAAALRALALIEQEPERRVELLSRARLLREQLVQRGWRIGSSASQIIPIFVGSAERAMEFSTRLLEAGYFVPGIRPPSVPKGESLLRISLSWSHTAEMIEGFLDVLGNETA